MSGLLPLVKTNRARTRRLAAAHSDTRACSLSSSGGEGRGEEASLDFRGKAKAMSSKRFFG